MAGHLIELDRLLGSRGLALRYAASMASRGRWLPFPALDRVLAALDQVTYDEIAARRAAPGDTERRDCLAIFLRIQQADDEGLMDDEMIAGFQRLLLVAGYDTTATCPGWPSGWLDTRRCCNGSRRRWPPATTPISTR